MLKFFNLLWLVLLSFLCMAQKDKIDYDMNRDTMELEEVKVSANLPLNDDKVVDFYRTNEFSTLDHINARLEGLSLIKRGGYALEPQVNGFSGGQLNVTIDGMRMFGACTDKMDPVTSYIEPSNLKNISISRGTNGSHNGCNIGGSIDMTLQEPSNHPSRTFYSSLGYGYESVSKGQNLLFSTGLGKKKWAWGCDGVFRKNENYTDGNNQLIPFTQFEKLNIHTVLKYFRNNVTSFKTDLLVDVARDVGYPALPMDVGLARAVLAAFEYQRNSKTKLKSKIYFNTIYHVMDDSKRDSLYLLEGNQDNKPDSVYMRMDMPGKSTTVGAYLQLSIPWARRNRLLLKGDNYTNHSLAEMTMHMQYPGFPPEMPMYMQTWPEIVRNVSGVFIQNTTYATNRFIVTVNGRVDFNLDVLQSAYGQQQFSVFNYSLAKSQGTWIKSFNTSFQYLFGESVSVISTLGYSDRMPTIGERLGFYLYSAYDGYDYIGTPTIRPEKSRFFSIGLQILKPRLKVNFNHSFSIVNDYIMGVTDTVIPPMNFYAKGIRVFSNLSEANLYSANLQLLYHPIQSFSIFMQSKYTYGVIKPRIPMPLIAPFKNIVAFQFQHRTVSLQAECESSIAQRRINQSYGETATPAFTIFNLKSGITIPFFNNKLDLGFGISNLFNKAYYEHLDWGRINRPGRNLELFLKFSH